jgi:hypothetical protein
VVRASSTEQRKSVWLARRRSSSNNLDRFSSFCSQICEHIPALGAGDGRPPQHSTGGGTLGRAGAAWTTACWLAVRLMVLGQSRPWHAAWPKSRGRGCMACAEAWVRPWARPWAVAAALACADRVHGTRTGTAPAPRQRQHRPPLQRRARPPWAEGASARAAAMAERSRPRAAAAACQAPREGLAVATQRPRRRRSRSPPTRSGRVGRRWAGGGQARAAGTPAMMALPAPPARPRVACVGRYGYARPGCCRHARSQARATRRPPVRAAHAARKRIWHGVSHGVDRPALRMGV